ncbi:hypothetical protein AVEN_29675-1 [Araneus ventricosus]|uniref:Endonuclease/exonuclease/phosphatase domain-containing protein n=1 Tax=Araneus ventricosus TaxID=182803 RepID=A0A4Y2Q984_ARAVE|nr:hypothetical protein AVEN_29675-1 [Araneus ventricosus]
MWGYRDIDSRGERILEFLLANNLFIANSSDAPTTFERGIFKGWPDLTISTQDIIGKFAKWEVSEEPSLSDHKYISVKIESQIQNSTYNRFKTLHGNHRKLLNKLNPSINPLMEEIRNSQTQDDINKTMSHLQNKIIDACKSTYETKKQEVARTLPGAHPN